MYVEKGKKPQVTTALDFMPDWGGDKIDEKKKSTPEDILALFKGIAATQKKRGQGKKEPLIRKQPITKKRK